MLQFHILKFKTLFKGHLCYTSNDDIKLTFTTSINEVENFNWKFLTLSGVTLSSHVIINQ